MTCASGLQTCAPLFSWNNLPFQRLHCISSFPKRRRTILVACLRSVADAISLVTGHVTGCSSTVRLLSQARRIKKCSHFVSMGELKIFLQKA